MKTLAEHINESELTRNIVISELNRGRSVYLSQRNGTDETVVTSQPALWKGERVDDGIGLIAAEGEGTFKDTYSDPIDQIDTIEQL